MEKGLWGHEKGETKEGSRSRGENGKFQKGSKELLVMVGQSGSGQKTFCDATVLYFLEQTLTTGPGTTFKDAT